MDEINQTQESKKKKQPVSLEQFIAFNNELSALSEAKIPIPLGLKNIGSNQPKALQQISQTISSHIESGKSLEEAIRLEKEQFPAMYYHVVEAGVRSGNISSVLESVSAFTWNFLKIRRSFAHALIYPITTVIIAYALFVLFLAFIVSTLEATYVSLGVVPGEFVQMLSTFSTYLVPWFWVPLLLLIFLLFILFRKQSNSYRLGQYSLFLSWIPGMKKIFSDYNCATFAEVLALLVDHKVPMHESLKLAAETTGDKKIIHSTIGLTNEIELGKPMHIINEKHQLSPYLWYLITQGHRESTFSDSLNNAAEMFRTRASDRSEDSAHG